MPLEIVRDQISTADIVERALCTLYGSEVWSAKDRNAIIVTGERQPDPAAAQVHATLALVSAVEELTKTLRERPIS